MKPLGLGMIGLHHQHPRWYWPLWARLPEYKPLAIADADEAFLKGEQEHFKLEAYSDYRRVLERKDIDAVILWLPHSQMPDAVEAAAAAGKHVIVEKPCAANLAGAKKIMEVSQRYPSIKISSVYCWRTHLVSGQIRQALGQGLLGRVLTMEGRLNAGGAYRYIRDKSPWMLKAAEGGGPMWNLGVHWVDYFRWMSGQEIVKVSGVATGPYGEPPRDIEDSAQALLTFSDGATGMLDISYTMPASFPGSRDIFVSFRGTSGAAHWAPAWGGLTDELLLVSEAAAAGEEKCRRLKITSKDIPGYCGQMAWDWLRDFAAAVREDRSPLVMPDDILAAVKVVDTFYRSLKSGKTENVEA